MTNMTKLTDNVTISNLFDFVCKLESKTYIMLAAICGRPTLLEICLRACMVILEQADFNQWNLAHTKAGLRPIKSRFELRVNYFCDNAIPLLNSRKNSGIHEAFLSCVSGQQRRIYVKLCTDRFFHSDLIPRGFDTISNCRWCINPISNLDPCIKEETFQHAIDYHLTKDLGGFSKAELLGLRKMVSHKRKFNFLTPSTLSGSVVQNFTKQVLNAGFSVLTPPKKGRKDDS